MLGIMVHCAASKATERPWSKLWQGVRSPAKIKPRRLGQACHCARVRRALGGGGRKGGILGRIVPRQWLLGHADAPSSSRFVSTIWNCGQFQMVETNRIYFIISLPAINWNILCHNRKYLSTGPEYIQRLLAGKPARFSFYCGGRGPAPGPGAFCRGCGAIL